MLHDGIIVGCAALYPHSENEAELACLAVGPAREWGYGRQLMKRVERRRRKAGIKRLFVLTTRTGAGLSARLRGCGSVEMTCRRPEGCPTYQRRSKVLFKTL